MTSSEGRDVPIKVFISYAHQDQQFVEQLESHLSVLKRDGLITTWTDRKISAGEEWSDAISEALRNSQIILVLVSADYLANSYIWEKELVDAFKRAETGDALILPIILRPTDWESTPLSLWQALPRGGRPVVAFRSTDEAWLDVARTVRRLIEDVRGTAPQLEVLPLVERKRLALFDVFKPSGVPSVTFVEPERFAALRLSLSQPGRGLVIEGPSGIGKTTALKKALEQLSGAARPDAIELLSARRPQDIKRIQNLDQDHKGTVAIDDFHRLGVDLRIHVIDYLKYLADYEVLDRKVVIVGIPRTGVRLVELAFDVATRIDVFKMGRVPDKLVIQMTEQGEKALNVRFARKSEVVRASNGSLNIAQLLCFHLCALQGIEQTREEIAAVDADVEAAISRVMEQIEPKFAETVRRFVSLGSRRDFTYAEMLKELAQSEDGFLSFPLLEAERPDLTAGARRFVDGRFIDTVYGKVPVASNHLLFDEAIPALVIDDPQLSFYLQQTPKSKLLRTAGKSNATSRDRVFISYSHKDSEWLERIRVHLRTLERENAVSIWDDSKIKVGRVWRDEIKVAIDSARIAILLVSANFLASDFIMDNELPPLLEAAEEDGAVIMVVIVSPSRYRQTRSLEKFQAVNSPDKPLSGMTFNEQEEVLVKLSETIDDSLSSDGEPQIDA
jgi:hypothetical protein